MGLFTWIKICYFLIGGVLVKGSHYIIQDCKDNPGSLSAVSGVTHSAECRRPCLKSAAVVWGSELYSYDSPLCKAALQDGRISFWNDSQRNVNFLRISSDIRRYYGSYSHGVKTVDYGALGYAGNGHYYFTSPRIEEPLLDVTSISRGFLTEDDSEPIAQECHLGFNAKGRTVTFQYYLFNFNGNLPKYPADGAPQGIRGGLGTNEWVTAMWQQERPGNYVPGGLWCLPSNTTYSKVLSLTMAKDAEFYPERWTVTASVGETVQLVMRRIQRSYNIRWKKDTVDFSYFHPQTVQENDGAYYKLTFIKTVVGNRGLYSLQGIDYRKRGISRLIMRNCGTGMYGPSCEFKCPNCQNGGVCHDVMGSCICPPGFNGTFCEYPCGENRFGAQCNQMCSDSNPGREPTCMGLLFCLPDPFGCSCAAGFKGLDCATTCSPGEFGAACEQRRDCHCQGDERFCNIFTGICPTGCHPGWKSLTCEISYPYLQSPPRLLGGGSRNLRLQLSPWDGLHGEGNPVAYLLEIKRNDSETIQEEFHEVNRLNYTYQTQAMSFSLQSLLPNTKYAVRAVLLDEDGHAQRDLAPYETFRTACGEPESPPENFNVSFADPKAVRVSWTFPEKRKWNCDTVSVRVQFNSSGESNSTLQSSKTHLEFLTDPYTQWRVAVRLETPNGKFGVWSDVIEGRSAEDAPDKVQNTKLLFNAENQTIEVTWEQPLKMNGLLRFYEVELYHLRWDHDVTCDLERMAITQKVKEENAMFQNVNFSSGYRVHIFAYTVKRGIMDYHDIHTPESVPSGPPTNLEVKLLGTDRVMIKWLPPLCQNTNGKVTDYVIWHRGYSPWDNKMTNDSALLPSAFIVNLSAFSEYEFMVHACTRVGCGELFASINLTTLSDKPPAPRNLTIYLTTMTTLAFSWQEPFPPNGITTEFRISYKIKGTAKDKNTVREASDLACMEPGRLNAFCYNLTGLQPMKTYVVLIRAINMNGTGPPITVEGITDESIPEAPERLNVTGRTSSSLMIVWDLPLRQNGKILGYQVNVTITNSEGDTGLILSRTLSTRELELSDLKPATLYSVFVSARTIKGYGPSAVANFSTKSPTLNIKEVPTIGAVLENTVALVIKPVNLESIPMSAYFVLVKEILEKEKDNEGRRRKRRCAYDPKQGHRRRRCSEKAGETDDKGVLSQDSLTVDYNTSKKQNLGAYATGKLLPDEVPAQGITFQIGDGRFYNGYYNAPLTTGHKYKLGMAVVSTYPEDPKACTYYLENIVSVPVRGREEAPPSSFVALVVGMVVICLLALTAFLLFLYYKKPQLFHSIKDKANSSFHIMNNNKEVVRRSKPQSLTAAAGNGSCCYGNTRNFPRKSPRSALSESSSSLEIYADCVPMKSIESSRVAVAGLELYVREGIESRKLVEEFQSLGKGQLHPSDMARLPENKCKNRYGNLLPYDHSRVVLEKIHNDGFSDYINASFVDGYKAPRKYVATQGPKPITMIDFWRMVWQLKVCKIAMVTNVLESGKVKCEKYWPDTTDRYGQLTIELKKTATFSDYVIRTFQVSKGEEESREVTQFHFTTWADHTVPMYPMAMGGFLKKMRAYEPENKSPIVVHCSAGVGRTGTLILLDSMMDMALEEDAVDLPSHLWTMRQNRISQVENPNQYVFAYQTLFEVLCGVDSSILCSNFYNEFMNLKKEDPKTGKTPITSQFESLDRRRHVLKPSDCKNGLDPNNLDKNRYSTIVPPDRSRPVLPAFLPENTSNYVNAVYVNGYKQRDAFVVTQMPLAHTVSDFWRMLKSTRTRSIVLLQDGGVEEYWPKEGTVQHGALKVTTTSTENQGDVIIREFTVNGPGPKEEVTIKQFHLQSWSTNEELPSSSDMFLDIIEKVERWQKQTGNRPITVQCLDGASASGLFCATVFICDKIKSDQEVDVHLAVRSIRNNRPQFITSQAQYMFCYQMAVTFLDSFEAYANFQ